MTADLDATWQVLEVQPVTPGHIRTHGTGRNTAIGEILVAIEDDGTRSVLFPTTDDDAFAPHMSTKVHLAKRTLQGAGGQGPFVAVTCVVNRLKPVFTTLAEDMLEAAEGSARPGGVLRNVLDEWRDLLAAEGRGVLGQRKLVGLVAELLTLRTVLSNDPHRDIGIWTGPDGGVHDLRRGERALEVKGSLVREGLFPEIHGLQQLEPPHPHGDLHLVVHRFDESPTGTLTVPDLIRDILTLGVDRRAFIERLSKVGYYMGDEATYRQRRFLAVERRVYVVDEAFPRLVPKSFAVGDVPAGILFVRYAVDLTGSTPAPLPGDEAEQVLAAFGGE